MKLEHPLYGTMVVPDDSDQIREELRIVRKILEENYHPVVQAYQDMLELALDLKRRECDEDAICI